MWLLLLHKSWDALYLFSKWTCGRRLICEPYSSTAALNMTNQTKYWQVQKELWFEISLAYSIQPSFFKALFYVQAYMCVRLNQLPKTRMAKKKTKNNNPIWTKKWQNSPNTGVGWFPSGFVRREQRVQITEQSAFKHHYTHRHVQVPLLASRFSRPRRGLVAFVCVCACPSMYTKQITEVPGRGDMLWSKGLVWPNL